jgi:hypothetical protein
MQEREPPSGACGIALKEWSGVCRALGDGRQTILLRKGGIAEENGVFRPEYPTFWLYPTHLHQEQQGLRDCAPDESRKVPPGSVLLESFADVEGFWWVDQIQVVNALSEFHIWTEETVSKRFHYREPGLWVLSVRVYRWELGRVLPELPEYEGCKSWVPLGQQIPLNAMISVLDLEQAKMRHESLASLLAARQ